VGAMQQQKQSTLLKSQWERTNAGARVSRALASRSPSVYRAVTAEKAPKKAPRIGLKLCLTFGRSGSTLAQSASRAAAQGRRERRLPSHIHLCYYIPHPGLSPQPSAPRRSEAMPRSGPFLGFLGVLLQLVNAGSTAGRAAPPSYAGAGAQGGCDVRSRRHIRLSAAPFASDRLPFPSCYSGTAGLLQRAVIAGADTLAGVRNAASVPLLSDLGVVCAGRSPASACSRTATCAKQCNGTNEVCTRGGIDWACKHASWPLVCSA
jgi:hypothetical protein